MEIITSCFDYKNKYIFFYFSIYVIVARRDKNKERDIDYLFYVLFLLVKQ